jgi:hypothetical protein
VKIEQMGFIAKNKILVQGRKPASGSIQRKNQ